VRDLYALDDPRADPAYINTRAPRHEGAARARANCDDLWRDFEPYASGHFLAEFPFRFHQRWFEMYLAVALLRAGLNIACPPKGAPDVRVQYADRRVLWLEATAPTGGDESTADRVVHPPVGVGFYVPTEQVTLRVSGALHAKAEKLREYRKAGVIAPEHQALVAINVHRIPHGTYDAERYGLGAIYGVGPMVLTYDRKSLTPIGSHTDYKPELRRSSGSSVDAAPFFHAGFEHVTGALISSTDAANCPQTLGFDFMLLPNPNATPAYTERQVPLGREWRLQRDEGKRYGATVIEHQSGRNR
jgi:hypothetical protein